MAFPADRSQRPAAVAAALFAVAIWAGWLPITRLGVLTRLLPEDVAMLRYGSSGVLLLPVLLARWREVPWRRFGLLLVIVLGAGVPYFLVFAHGLRYANSGQGAVLGPGAVSVFTALAAWLALGERLRRPQLTGIAITAGGILLVVLHDLAAGGARVGGFALILVASVSWAAFTVASRTLRMKPIMTTTLIAVANGALYLPLYLASGGWPRLVAAPGASVALQLFYQGFLTGIAALLAYTFAISRLGAAGAASFTPLSPVLIASFGWLILGDTIDAATTAGLAAVAIGVLVANRAYAPFTARR